MRRPRPRWAHCLVRDGAQPRIAHSAAKRSAKQPCMFESGTTRRAVYVAIRRGPRSALQPAPLKHLVVLDFEWTADNRRPMLARARQRA